MVLREIIGGKLWNKRMETIVMWFRKMRFVVHVEGF
jgi:hypothetical protein